jgi:hypothetical protein
LTVCGGFGLHVWSSPTEKTLCLHNVGICEETLRRVNTMRGSVCGCG